jgi:hypothetical protein
MFNFDASEPGLLKTVLQPLLEDFQYWFEQSRSLLETQNIEFLGSEGQLALLARVELAQQEVRSAQMLMEATNGQVGVETSVLVPWHQLVTECWQVAIRFRLSQSAE